MLKKTLLPILLSVEKILYLLDKKIVNFPKSRKLDLGAAMNNLALNCFVNVNKLNYSTENSFLEEDLMGDLMALLGLIRLCNRNLYLSIKDVDILSELINKSISYLLGQEVTAN